VIALLTAVLFFGGIAVLNKTVTTSQGVDFKVSRIPLPLYLKILNFYDRHFSLQWLENRITNKLEAKEDKVFRLFEWTHSTIKPQPNTLPIMDDHVWNVYVRRYGISENFNDLFSTLCNYAGVESYFDTIYNDDRSKKMSFTLVSIDNKDWVVFDPYNGVYFKTTAGNWATISDIRNGDWKLSKIVESDISESNYKFYLEKLSRIERVANKRASIQSPLNRLKHQINKWFSGEKPLLE